MGGAERAAARKAAAEVIGIDHVYIAGEPHVHYDNRYFGFSFRPARPGRGAHDPYALGLHHFCFRVEDEGAVDAAAEALRRMARWESEEER